MNSEERSALTTQFWRFLWSAILIALSGCLGNVVDSIIVGNLIGGDGVSAINLSKPVVQFMFTISMLISAGAGMLVGMALGKQDHQRAAYIYTHSFFGSLVWLCQNEHLFQSTRDYLVVMLWGAPAYMVMWALSTMVGVDGSPRLVSIAILIDNAVNLALDIVFIQYLGWGIAGSSAATVVGHLVGIVLMLRHWFYANNHLHFTHVHEQPAWGSIISQGAPLAVASICLTLLLLSANSIVLSSLGRTGIFAFAVCMNLLQIYNLFLSGTCRTLQSLGAIQVGKGDQEAFRLILRKAFSFITVAMILTCVFVWIDPQAIALLFGADGSEQIAETDHALRVFSLSFIPFCYIYVVMIVYKLYKCHKMALFISFALSLTVIPVMWLMARLMPDYLWYSYLIAYVIEILAIVVLHRMGHLRFEWAENAK